MKLTNPFIMPPLKDLPKIFNVKETWANLQRRKHIKQLIDQQEEILNRWETLLNTAKSSDEWFVYDRIKEHNKILDRLRTTHMHLKNVYKDLKFMEQDNQATAPIRPRHTEYDIEAIKRIPIKEILQRNSIPIQNKRFFRLRQEKTPSCWIYEDQNRYWDFGTNEGGDVINLYQKITGQNFKDSLKDLSFYI